MKWFIENILSPTSHNDSKPHEHISSCQMILFIVLSHLSCVNLGPVQIHCIFTCVSVWKRLIATIYLHAAYYSEREGGGEVGGSLYNAIMLCSKLGLKEIKKDSGCYTRQVFWISRIIIILIRVVSKRIKTNLKTAVTVTHQRGNTILLRRERVNKGTKEWTGYLCLFLSSLSFLAILLGKLLLSNPA